MNKLRVVVTGGLGYLGSHVVHRLLRLGHEVVTLDRSLPGQRRNLFPDEQFILTDVMSPQPGADAGIIKTADAVIHLAALIDAPQSVYRPELYYQVNFVGTLNMLALAKSLGAHHFLFASSAAVYGSDCVSPLKEEDATTTPENPYGGSKLFGEALVKDVCFASNMTSGCFRLFNLVGVKPEVGVAPANKGLFSMAVDAMLHTKSLNIYGDTHPTKDGSCIRDFVYVDEVARGIVLGLTHLAEGTPSFVVNLGTGTGISVKEVLEAAKVLYKVLPARAGEVPVSVSDSSKASTILGWKANISRIDDYLDQEFIVKQK